MTHYKSGQRAAGAKPGSSSTRDRSVIVREPYRTYMGLIGQIRSNFSNVGRLPQRWGMVIFRWWNGLLYQQYKGAIRE